MKLVVRAMGSFLVAALAVALIISMLSNTLIPELSQYVKNTFPAEQNLEFVSAVASDPDPEHTAPEDGDIYENDSYKYVYVADLEGWSVSVINKGRARYDTLFESIYGKPVVDMSNTFENCVALTSAPAIPRSVTNLSSAFKGCTALSGLITVHANPDVYSGCFNGTGQPIVLIGNSDVLDALAATSANGNVAVD